MSVPQGDAGESEGARLQERAVELYQQRQFQAALEAAERAVAVLAQVLGPGHVDVAFAHQLAGGLYSGVRQPHQAEQHYRLAIEIYRASGSTASHRTTLAITLHNLAILFATHGYLAEAEPQVLEALRVLDEVGGDVRSRRGNVLATLARIRDLQGRAEDAELLYQEALGLRRQAPGERRGDLLDALEKLAEFLTTQGAHAQAERHYREALTLREEEFGADSLEAAEGANHVARVLMARGELGEAGTRFEQSLRLGRRHLGPQDPALATALNNLAVLYRRTGRPEGAEAMYREALAIYQGSADHSAHANALANLGNLYEEQGRGPDAETAYRGATDILSNARTDPHYVQALDALARVYERTGRQAEAERALQELLELSRAGGDRTRELELEARLEQTRQTPGTDGSSGFGAKIGALKESIELNRRAQDQHQRGRYREAMELTEQAVALVEGVAGAGHDYLVVNLSNVGTLALELGDFPRAESAFRRALAVAEKTRAPDDPTLGTLFNNLGEFHRAKGDRTQARQAYEQALALREKAPGRESAEYATTLNSLASLHKDAGDFATAERLYREAYEIFERAGDEPGRRVTGANLGFLAFLRGDDLAAKELLERALVLGTELLGPDHLDLALNLDNLAVVEQRLGVLERAQTLLSRALAILEASVGSEHYRMAQTLRHLASVEGELGDTGRAVERLSRSAEIEETHLLRILAGGSESERQSAVDTLVRESHETVAFHVEMAPHEPAAARLALETIIRRKGRVLDAMADSVGTLRARSTPEIRALFDRLAEVSARLAALDAPSPGSGPASPRAALTAELHQEWQRLDKLVSQRSAEYQIESDRISLERVQRSIPPGAALVEFFRYRPAALRRGRGLRAALAFRYVAYALRRDGEPGWVDLGDVATLDGPVATFRDALADPTRQDVAEHARALGDRVMRPLRGWLGDTRDVLVSPDGLLNLVPFGALQDETGRYLVEQGYTFTYLTSGRDLLRLARRAPSRGVPVVVAGVDYSVRGHDPSRRQWPLLPHTLGEADAVTDVFPDASMLTAGAATESALRAVAGPRVLHVATHGYFDAEEDDESRAVNPLLRAGLILAGANGAPTGADDGVLTALECSRLDLWGTRLVVLSACETGLGEVRHGEGVYGLRRALVLAGAESQVISLWQVSSVATRALMRDYYGQLSTGMGRTDALHAVQRQMLTGAHRHPYYWAAFIPSGAWEPLPPPAA